MPMGIPRLGDSRYRTNSILCMPVSYEGTVVAVAQLVNKTIFDKAGAAGPGMYSEEDIEMFKPFAQFAGISLRNCRTWMQLLAQKRKDALYRKVCSQGVSRSDGHKNRSNCLTP